ncbi:MAG: tRNA (pseudouridine(54)-N(1))-methyltransferase TrmY [Nanoarchaeota archaeon]|nr:tRNA (pseudouridine(54)-N(1))-methyltransferase TrmY [Nanoarchaeota archaeon]
MRHFIYFSQKARTTGNFGDDLMKAGRMDIACQIVIMAFFISNKLRDNVKLHLIFNGPPDPPKHIEMYPGKKLYPDDKNEERDISKKDVAGLLKKLLYKYRQGEKREVMPGYYIEKKSFINIINELGENSTVFLLDKKGEDIRTAEIPENPVFILGDHEGIPKDEMKRLKKINIKKVSVGNTTYFASQTLTIVQNELDRRGIE